MPLQIVRNDIANMSVDAIVNTANPNPIIGGGVDARIHEKAGPSLLGARKWVGAIACGEAKVTPAFQLNAAHVIHTVGPLWVDGEQGELRKLASCYRHSLELAAERKCESIAFPLIAAGTYRFPKDAALETAIRVISGFLEKHDMTVYLVVYDKNSYMLSEKLFTDIKRYIDLCQGDEPDSSVQINNEVVAGVETTSGEPEDATEENRQTFTEALLEWIKIKNLKERDVYKRSNLDRIHFAKIRNNIAYMPSKLTAMALAFGLGLSLDETKELIGRAGYTLSHNNRFDIIVEYFLSKENYNIYEINKVLFAFDQPMIGG